MSLLLKTGLVICSIAGIEGHSAAVSPPTCVSNDLHIDDDEVAYVVGHFEFNLRMY